MVKQSKSKRKVINVANLLSVPVLNSSSTSSSSSCEYDLPSDHPDIVGFLKRQEGYIEETTRSNYEARWNQFVKWLMIAKPELINDGDVKQEPPISILMAYWNHISIIQKGKREGKPISVSYMGQHSSALKHGFQKRNWNSKWIEVETYKFTKAHGKVVAKVKGKDGDVEGKQPMEFDEFRDISMHAISCIGSIPYAWLFGIMAWILIARSVTVSDLVYANFYWSQDCIQYKHEY